MNTTLRKFAIAAIVTAGLCFAGTGTAVAGGCCHWKTVTVYVLVTKSYTYYVTKYDHCGNPFQVAKTGFKTFKVPVQKRIQVCY